MNYWWVNHKQTHASEIRGGYVWSPKTEKNGARSQFYINLTLVEPGEIVFSYADAQIKAIGVVISKHREQNQPSDFGNKGNNWDAKGWIVPIEWCLLSRPFSPKIYIDQIAPLLPNRYSPITQTGSGNQKCYLAEISKELANLLLSIANNKNTSIKDQIDNLLTEIVTEGKVQEVIKADIEITEKDQLIKARLGQGIFKQKLMEIESRCRLTGVSDPSYLVASHIKPWRVSDNNERLDGNNGLLLSPHVDRLFDRGWISFEDDGRLIISSETTKEVMTEWGLAVDTKVGKFSDAQREYLEYHREQVLKNIP